MQGSARGLQPQDGPQDDGRGGRHGDWRARRHALGTALHLLVWPIACSAVARAALEGQQLR
eukprot:9340956-Alexandrium_andersonii.AAC.1